MLILCVLLLILSSKVNGKVNGCKEERRGFMYLDIAEEMIDKAKLTFMNEKYWKNFIQRPLDCADVLHSGNNTSETYLIWPANRLIKYKPIRVYCDMDTDGGGWTVIQRRGNFKKANDYFYKDWESYKNGFGNIEEDFWIGNDIIFALTNQKLYSVRFDLVNVELKKRHAVYDTFWIDDEYQNYTLHISGYSGDAGESMLQEHNLKPFSTKDRDNDYHTTNCAESYKGGWWYDNCHDANLNGLYLRGKHDASSIGIHWKPWTGFQESLESTEIKIRPLTYI